MVRRRGRLEQRRPGGHPGRLQIVASCSLLEPEPRGARMSKVIYEKRDRIAYVTINRPEAKNAVDPDVHRLMIEAWEDFRDDDSLDVAILTGTGDAFCAGADLKTYIPPWIKHGTARMVRDNVATGLG